MLTLKDLSKFLTFNFIALVIAINKADLYITYML